MYQECQPCWGGIVVSVVCVVSAVLVVSENCRRCSFEEVARGHFCKRISQRLVFNELEEETRLITLVNEEADRRVKMGTDWGPGLRCDGVVEM